MSRLVSFFVLVGILVLIALLFYQVMAVFVVPLFLAALLGVVFQPWYRLVLKYCRRLSSATLPLPARYRQGVSSYLAAGERYLAAGLATLTVLLAVLIPLGAVVSIAAVQGVSLLEQLRVANVRQKADELRSSFDLEIPLHGDLLRIEASLKHWRDMLRLGQTPQFHRELIENLEDRVLLLERWRTGQGEAAPIADAEPLLAQFAILRDAQLETREADEAMRAADAEFRLYKRDLLGGPWMAVVKEFVNPTDEQLDVIRKQAIGSLGSPILEFGSDTLKVLAKLIFGLIIIVAALFFLFAEGAWMLDAAIKLSPLEQHYVRELIEEFDRVCRAVVLATLLSAAAQAVLAAIGFYFVGLSDSVALLTLLTFVLAMVPFTGAFTVWGPVAAYLYFVKGDVPAAIGLVCYGTLIISAADNVIKPLVLSGQSNLHPLLALLSVIGGITALGPIGILIGPMAVVFLQTLLKLLQRELLSLDRLRGGVSRPAEGAPGGGEAAGAAESSPAATDNADEETAFPGDRPASDSAGSKSPGSSPAGGKQPPPGKKKKR